MNPTNKERARGERKHESDCCHAEVKVVGDSFGEGTMHWECMKCGESCNDLYYYDDVVAVPIREESWEQEVRRAFGEYASHQRLDQQPFIDWLIAFIRENRVSLLKELEKEARRAMVDLTSLEESVAAGMSKRQAMEVRDFARGHNQALENMSSLLHNKQ